MSFVHLNEKMSNIFNLFFEQQEEKIYLICQHVFHPPEP